LKCMQHLAGLKFATTCLAGALVAIATTPSVADEQFAATAVVQLPDAQILSAFDISFVDPKSHSLVVAASRVVGSGGAFGTVIIVDTQANVVTTEYSDWATNCPEYKVTAVQVSPSNGPTEWQEQYDELARKSRRIAATVEAAE